MFCGAARRVAPMQPVSSPSVPPFRNTHGVHSDPPDARPSKFVLLQPPSLFSLPLSLFLSLSVGVSRCLLFSPLSLTLSLFSLSPSLRCYRGACIFFFF